MAIAEFFIIYFINYSAPVVGFEPTTISLTGSRSTVELHRNIPILKKKNEKCKKKINLKVADTSLPADRQGFAQNKQAFESLILKFGI